jgi:hypothetical protein
MTKKATHAIDTSANTQRGQAIVLIAMGFIMLLAFTGLVVDVARVFVTRGELRRAVDAAGLAASAQFKRGATAEKIVQAAHELVVTHGLPTPSVIVETCSLGAPTGQNNNLCAQPGEPQRKLVRVKATAQVPMLFLQIIGIPTVEVAGENVSEAASVDAVLVLDNSESQSYDFAALPNPYASKCNQSDLNNMYACLNGGTLSDGTTITGCNNETISDPNYPELTRGICQPFRKTKEAAYAFIQRLYQNYDRIALINFNENANRLFPMGYQLTDAIAAINNMDVYVSPTDASQPNPSNHILCNSSTPSADRWKCGSSNIGAGLIRAHDEFGLAVPYREDSLWVTILLVDGPPNRTSYDWRLSWSDMQYGTCPQSEQAVNPRCRDTNVNTRHTAAPVVDPLYDSDDYARDYADILGLNPDLYPSAGSAGVLVYTIALGQNSVCLTGSYSAPSGTAPATCTPMVGAYGDEDAGEQLLRYVADVGDDGRLDTGPCLDPNNNRSNTTKVDPDGRSDDAGLGMQCGNYYFAPDAGELERIFLEIAGRIFTRISG